MTTTEHECLIKTTIRHLAIISLSDGDYIVRGCIALQDLEDLPANRRHWMFRIEKENVTRELTAEHEKERRLDGTD